MSTTAEFGRGKTIFVLAIVIGCFAVLWPKIFYPMLTASINPTNGENVPAAVAPSRPRKGFEKATSMCCDVISVKDTNAHKIMNEICTNIMRREQLIQQQAQQPKSKKAHVVKVSATTLCRNEILQTCGVDITGLLKEDHSITPEYKKSLGQLRNFNTSLCIKMNYGVDFREIGLPRHIKRLGEEYSNLRQERSFRPGPDMVHPALRERGRAIPTVSIPRRTIEREARPGPVPGMRPPVGVAGHIPAGPKGGGTMGIIMPMYTIGIVCFFLYTIMKILFKKPPESEQAMKQIPQVKDYGMDPEHRKYVFSEEYAEGSERSLREAYNKEDRELGIRRRPSAGKSSRFYEDRRRLDLETKSSTETELPTHSCASSSSSIEKDIPQASKESLETESPTKSPATTTITTDDTIKTEISVKSPETNSVSVREIDKEPQPEPVITPSPSNDFISHDESEPPAKLHDEQTRPRQSAEKDSESSVVSQELSRTASLASSADTVVATAGIESPRRTSSIDERGSCSAGTSTAPEERKASVVSPFEMGPFSPLAPEQTPNDETEEFHFFDRTIVIPDYDPVDPAAESKEMGPPATEMGQPTSSMEEVDQPDIKIVKQDSVPHEVLEMADQVAEKILDAAKSESVVASLSIEKEITAVTEPPSAGETLTDADTTTTEPITFDYPTPSALQPRLSLDTNITAATLESATDTALVHEQTNASLITQSSDTISAPLQLSSPASLPPSIQVETPHADQTELNKIAEFLETLNTEPKETEKLAAVAAVDLGEIVPDSPIVTLAEESKVSLESAVPEKPDEELSGKSKIEITPFEDIQPPMLDRLGLGDLPDICYVTQPLDDSQKGRNRAQFLKSRVEIVSIDESLAASEPATSEIPIDTERKTSEPAPLSGIGESQGITKSLEEVVKKLRHVPGEFSPEQKDEKAKKRRKSSAASDHSQVEAPKPSEIDKYVDRLANMQETRKAMLEREMLKSSQSSQGSGADQQAEQSSSFFHGPGLLDSGQIAQEKTESLSQADFPPCAETEDNFLDKMKAVEKWATSATNQSIDKVESSNEESIYSNETTNFMRSVSQDNLEPGTTFVSSTPSEEVLNMVASLIDQALRDGIHDVVQKVIQDQEKIDENSSGGNILASISDMELKDENLGKSLEEQLNMNNLSGNKNEATNRVIHLTDMEKQLTSTQSPEIGTTSTRAHAINIETRRPENDNTSKLIISPKSILAEESNLGIPQITEVSEISSTAATAADTTTISAEALYTPTNTREPKTVETLTATDPAFFAPTSDTEIHPVVPVVETLETQSENKEKVQLESSTNKETGIVPQEQAESLSAKPEKMETVTAASGESGENTKPEERATSSEDISSQKEQQKTVSSDEAENLTQEDQVEAPTTLLEPENNVVGKQTEPEVVQNEDLQVSVASDGLKEEPILTEEAMSAKKPELHEVQPDIQAKILGDDIKENMESPTNVPQLFAETKLEETLGLEQICPFEIAQKRDEEIIAAPTTECPASSETKEPQNLLSPMEQNVSPCKTEIATEKPKGQDDLDLTTPRVTSKDDRVQHEMSHSQPNDKVQTERGTEEMMDQREKSVLPTSKEEEKLINEGQTPKSETTYLETQSEEMKTTVSEEVKAELLPDLEPAKPPCQEKIVNTTIVPPPVPSTTEETTKHVMPQETSPVTEQRILQATSKVQSTSESTETQEAKPVESTDEILPKPIEKPEEVQQIEIATETLNQNVQTVQMVKPLAHVAPEAVLTETESTETVTESQPLELIHTIHNQSSPLLETSRTFTEVLVDSKPLNDKSHDIPQDTSLQQQINQSSGTETALVEPTIMDDKPSLPVSEETKTPEVSLHQGKAVQQDEAAVSMTDDVASSSLSASVITTKCASKSPQVQEEVNVPNVSQVQPAVVIQQNFPEQKTTEDQIQSNTVATSTPLRFETLSESEPPLPIPSTTTPTLSQTQQSTDLENNEIIDIQSSPPSNTVSFGPVVDNNILASGTSMALTVELLDENSPEIFPLPSTTITSTTDITTVGTPPTSPVEKAQLDQSNKEKVSPNVNAGVSRVAAATATDQASSATTTCVEVLNAEKQATQASSAMTTDHPTPTVESPKIENIFSSPEIITDESREVPPTSPAPPPTPAAYSEPPSFSVPSAKLEVYPQLPQPQVERKDDDEANNDSGHRERDAIVTAVKGIVEAFDATKTSPQSKAASPPPATKKEGKAAPEEDLEKLIASAEKPSTAAKKEDLGSPSKNDAQPPSSSPVSVVKPALRDKREKSIEKEVKFKLPPEEMEVEEEEEEIEEEEEVEIVRPPTPPKTLSKAKPKSPEPPTTPEPFGTPLLASTSSHRSNHDELLISSMQTTVAGSAADNLNKSPSPAALIADYYNIITPKITSPTLPASNTPTHSPQPPLLFAENNALNSDLPTITETVTVPKLCHDDPNGDKQSAVAAIAQAKAGMSSPSPTSGVSVIGIEETASLITGERWDMNRTPTPTFRQPTPPVPHRPPSPPDQIPSIYLEGPMPTRGQEFVVREAQVEVEGGDDYDYDDDYEPSGPVILSGKVTLSVISSAAGTAHEDVTDAPSLSLDDMAQAERSRGKSLTGGRSAAVVDTASAKTQIGRGKSNAKKSSNPSSPDMNEYEVIGKGGFEREDDESADVSLDDFLTATDAEQEGERAQEDTAADISTMDDLKQEPLPKDEE